MDYSASVVLNVAKSEVGYLEKKSNSQLDDKTANAGSNNYTKYGRDMHNLYPSIMDFPAAWCDCFVDWCFYKAYGATMAQRMLCGHFDDYTVSSAQLYKDAGAWYTSPKVGDQIFFKNSTRICHTGLVYAVDSKYVYTYEGNTSSGNEVIANGGAVCAKKYELSNARIAGYGRPKYDAEKVYKQGWNEDGKGWWYADTTKTYYKASWQTINGCRYYFNSEGYAVTGWQKIDGAWYFFENTKGADKECALYLTDASGKQAVGKF